jgi:hypothetical protein
MALQIRRGIESERTGVVFAEGELVYITDTDKLYIGDNSTAGGIEVGPKTLSELGAVSLSGNLTLGGNNIDGTGNINITGDITASGNITAGGNIDIGDAADDTLTISAKVDSGITPNADATYDLGSTTLKWNNIHAVRLDGDVEGSVFGDDSTLLVDGNNNKIVGAVDTASLTVSSTNVAIGNSAGLTGQNGFAVAIGTSAGLTNQSTKAVAVGDSAGNITQGEYSVAVGNLAGQTTQGANAVAVGRSAGVQVQGASAVAIGYEAGSTGQGANAIAIGEKAGYANQAANSIVINATGAEVYNTGASSLIITPVRNAVGTTAVMYDATTGEVTHTATPAFDLQGDVTGDVTGNVTGQVKGSGGSAVLAPNQGPADAVISVFDINATGTITGGLTGDVLGNLTGNAAGDHTGTFAGVITATGTLDGDVTGSIFADNSTLLVDAVAGNIPASVVSGTFTGNVTGDTAGVHTGNIFTTLIDSADSSTISFTPDVQFDASVSIDQAMQIGPSGSSTTTFITPNSITNYDSSNLNGAVYTNILGSDINDPNAFPLQITTAFETKGGAGSFYNGIQVIGDGATAALQFFARTTLNDTSALKFTEYSGVVGDDTQEEDGANYTDVTTISNSVADFGTAVKFASMTTGVRNALTPAAGMVVFNTTETKLQVYTGSAWADLH